MLCLSRKIGEKLIIGEGENQIVLTINRISGNRVTVGIEAPGSVRVVRGELERYPAPIPAAPLAAFLPIQRAG